MSKPSYASATQGIKRTVKHAADSYAALLKKGPFVPSTQYLKHLEDRQAYRNITHALPKSAIQFGIRINFGIINPMLVDPVSEAIGKLFPKAVSIDTKLVKGFIDVGFKTADDANAAATANMTVNDKVIPITRTRYSGDQNLFISFDSLPTTMGRKELLQELREGLGNYGEVIQLEMQRYDLLPNLAMSKAIAMIKPNKNVAKDLTIIPRLAFLYDKGVPTADFRIHPEAAPPICSNCKAAGHRVRDCPDLIEGLEREDDDDMDDDLDLSSAQAPCPWGDDKNYKVVDPVTRKERQIAKRNRKELADQAAQDDPQNVEVQPKGAEDQPKGTKDQPKDTQDHLQDDAASAHTKNFVTHNATSTNCTKNFNGPITSNPTRVFGESTTEAVVADTIQDPNPPFQKPISGSHNAPYPLRSNKKQAVAQDKVPANPLTTVTQDDGGKWA